MESPQTCQNCEALYFRARFLMQEKLWQISLHLGTAVTCGLLAFFSLTSPNKSPQEIYKITLGHPDIPLPFIPNPSPSTLVLLLTHTLYFPYYINIFRAPTHGHPMLSHSILPPPCSIFEVYLYPYIL